MNNPITIMGEKTPRVVVYKHESHKLHQAFPVSMNGSDPEKISKGQPVALKGDGTIIPYSGSLDELYLGVAMTDSYNPAYAAQHNFPMEVTVAVRGYLICNYISASQIKCGYVKPNGVCIRSHFPQVESSTTPTNFIAISVVDNANEIVQVLVL